MFKFNGDQEASGVFWDSIATIVNAWMPSYEEGSIGYLIVMGLTAFVGLMFISVLIGIVTSAIEEKIVGLRKGNSIVIEEGHTVILGFCPGEYTLIRQLILAAEESLTGRVGIINMDGLSISEITGRENLPFLSDISKIPSRKTDSSFELENIFDYIVRGSLPQLYDDPDTPRDIFYSSYISTYIEKDLREILEIRNETKFINFMRLLASNTGQELIYDVYAKEIGININTVKSWISVLNKTGIVHLLQPYNEQSIAKRIIKRPKMYFFDTGLAAYLSGIDSSRTLVRSFLKERFFETFAVNEIRKSFINEGIQIDYYYYRDNNQNEIDLVYIRDGEIHMIEIKSGTSFNESAVKGFRQLDKTNYLKGKNAVVCSADKLSALPDGTLLIPVSLI